MKLSSAVVIASTCVAAVLTACGRHNQPPPPPPPPVAPTTTSTTTLPPAPTPAPTAEPIVTAPPAPACEMPTSCPALTRWGISIDPHMQDGAHNPVKVPVVGGTIHWDTTPRFGGKGNDGQPCNEEHHTPCESACGAWRHCEDPRGPDFKVEGPAQTKAVEGFGIRVKVTGRGKITLTACPRKDAKDAYGVPLQTSQAACSSRFVTVR